MAPRDTGGDAGGDMDDPDLPIPFSCAEGDRADTATIVQSALPLFEDIDLVSLQEDAPDAYLAWGEDNGLGSYTPRLTRLNFITIPRPPQRADEGFALVPPTDNDAWELTGLAIAPTREGTDIVYLVAGHACAEPMMDPDPDPFAWTGLDVDGTPLSNPGERCGALQTTLWRVEQAGGYDPFTARADEPAAVFFEDNPNEDYDVSSLQRPWGGSEHIGASLPNAPNIGQGWVATSRSNLVLIADKTDEVYAFDALQTPRGVAAGHPPFPLGLQVSRLGADIAAIGPAPGVNRDYYLVAHRTADNGTVVVRRLEHDRIAGGIADEVEVSSWTNAAQVVAIDLATFRDGAAMVVARRQASGTIDLAFRLYAGSQPVELSECETSHQLEGELRDLEVDTIRLGRDLVVVAAVSFASGAGQHRLELRSVRWAQFFPDE